MTDANPKDARGPLHPYAWRTRVSDLRRPPFNMQIRNRQRRIESADEAAIISEYMFVPVNNVVESVTVEGAASGADTSPAAG